MTGTRNKIAALLLLLSIGAKAQQFTAAERQLILSGNKASAMRVLQVTDAADLKVLKAASSDVKPGEEALERLIERMYATVTDPSQAGVGIAAPQVGINRNIVWVQRFDKQGDPFNVYLNPKILWRSGLLRKGVEGCLSIPDISGNVLRNYAIRISYLDREGKPHEEMVEGFTAVIFQHEIDHINGILFTDRLKGQESQAYFPASGEIDLYLQKQLVKP